MENINYTEKIIKSKSPSNIALIKYWGNYYNQIPSNPSISYTLNKCFSKTELLYKKKISKNISLNFFFKKKKKKNLRLKYTIFLKKY